MGQAVRFRKHGTVTFLANQQQYISLSRGTLFREIYLRYKGTPTCTLGNNTAANTKRGDEWGAIKKIELVANGTDVLRSITGEELRMLNFYWYGNPPRITAGIGDGATANPPFDSVLILPLWTPQIARPFDTILDTRNFTDLRLVITWGDYTDINASATAWTVNPTVEVRVLESAGVNGQFAIRRMQRMVQTVSAANAELKIDLRTGPIFKGFYINTQATGGATDSKTILNNVKVVSGPTVFFDSDPQTILQSTRLRRDIPLLYERALNSGTGGIGRFGQSTSADADAWYWVDLCPDGYLSEAVDSAGMQEISLLLDVSGASQIIVIPDEIFPVRQAA